MFHQNLENKVLKWFWLSDQKLCSSLSFSNLIFVSSVVLLTVNSSNSAPYLPNYCSCRLRSEQAREMMRTAELASSLLMGSDEKLSHFFQGKKARSGNDQGSTAQEYFVHLCR